MDNTERDNKIFTQWLCGKDYKVLASEYNLSAERIKEICVKRIPAKVKQYVWQGMHQYAKYRAWMRKERGLPDLTKR